jgi:hypothetical protein
VIVVTTGADEFDGGHPDWLASHASAFPQRPECCHEEAEKRQYYRYARNLVNSVRAS